MSAETFPYDAFLSHSLKDKAVVRPLAERLRGDKCGLQPSAFIVRPFPAAPIKGFLAQFLYINWCPAERTPTRPVQGNN